MGIPIGRIGIIKAGECKGWQVKVEDDSENTGGFLVLISRDFATKESEGYDSWVENEAGLDGYFRDSQWLVEWL